MELTKEQIEAILQSLVEGEYLSETEKEAIKNKNEVAEYWVEEAEKTWIENPTFANKSETIKTILNISPNGFPERQGQHFFKIRSSKVEEGLPIPREVDFDYKHLPYDFTELSDLEIRRYSSHNLHFLNRARYLLANTINHLADATHLRDEAYRKAFKENYEALNKPTKDLVDALARQDDEYLKYDFDVRQAQADVNNYKALVDIFSSNVDRLSREATMRNDEWKRTGGC